MPLLIPTDWAGEDGDWIVRQFVTPDDLALNPEEYVAWHAHALGTFSFLMDQFQDSTLASWVGRVAELLASEAEVERCRGRFLTPEEHEFARRQDAVDL